MTIILHVGVNSSISAVNVGVVTTKLSIFAAILLR